ncbi:MAG: 50S ribosomal protein L3, partial [Candidatus Thermoplasmatota archaeon]
MGKKHHPRRGSLAYSPRKRARRETPKVSSWPEINEPNPRIQGFAGYKAGMTHAMVIDTRKESTTSGQEICVPVTVLEVPPMKVFGIRVYGLSANGLVTLSEVSSPDIDKYLERVYPIPKKKHGGIKEEDKKNIEDVRLIVHTQPKLVTGVPKKKPEIMELRVGGATIEKRLDYAYSVLGKEIKITDFTKEGSLVDVIAVTKGKGFEGAIKRWGVKLLFHKNSKHRRMIG